MERKNGIPLAVKTSPWKRFNQVCAFHHLVPLWCPGYASGAFFVTMCATIRGTIHYHNSLPSLPHRLSSLVHIPCSGLKMTNLLQVVNRFDASWFSKLFIHKLDSRCATCNKSVNNKFHQVWLPQIWCNLMKPTGLIQLNKPVKSTTCVKSVAFLAV